jgi:putative sterol carrier protein
MAAARATDALATRVRESSPRTRELIMRGPLGRAVTAAIFRAMPQRLRPASATGLDLVVRWNVEGEPLRHLVIKDGRARVQREADREPDLTVALDRATLLDLATGAANGPQLFMTGRLRITGDLMLAQRLTALFTVPATG